MTDAVLSLRVEDRQVRERVAASKMMLFGSRC